MGESMLLSKGKEEEEDDLGSSDEALLEMLGLASLETALNDEEEKKDEQIGSKLPNLSISEIASFVKSCKLGEIYKNESLCIFPWQFSVSAEHMRRLTEELVWGGDHVQADKTYETIQIWKNGEIQHRRTLTRLENFVDAHEGWSELCHGYLSRILSEALGEKMVLYKEKLNLKPAGGSGFAPHLDSPSLRIALGPEGPQNFCTVMVASKLSFAMLGYSTILAMD